MSPYEDIFFYLDLTKEILKKKEVVKAIKFYISERNKTNVKGNYGLLIFQEAGDPIFITDKADSDIIENAIEENWKNRPKEQSFFENGLFYIFSYIAETIRKKSRHNRIIIITDTPSDLAEEYTEALFGLVSKIKGIPTFIDIIRISEKEERFFRDDVKLNILANDTKGRIFYLSDRKDFMDIIKSLTKSKEILNLFQQDSDKFKIKKEDYDFYSRLAKNLIPAQTTEVGLKCHLCQEEICPSCADVNDTLQLCENCKSPFHNCCVTNYTIQNNIGIPFIFRCPNTECQILLKIDQEEIVTPNEDTAESIEEFIEKDGNIPTFAEDLIEDSPGLSDAERHYQETESVSENNQGKKSEQSVRKVRIGGFFGKTYTIKKEGDKIIYQKISTPNGSSEFEDIEEKEINLPPKPRLEKVMVPQSWSPSRKTNEADNDKNKPSEINCPSCGTQINDLNSKIQLCPYCGHRLEL
ncbi:MAG: zinc-ribbon domain-containing protein [Candidatus Lokiarchaeota archaeon]|nr:zinc-ribbon domain-containing protein [Candidatus Lokiarchaeota archaeon]